MRIIDPIPMEFSHFGGAKIEYAMGRTVQWSAATAYIIGDTVIYYSRRFYAVGAGTNHAPVAEATTAYWRDDGVESYSSIPMVQADSWLSTTTYSAGNKVGFGIAGGTTIYRSIADGNLNHLPTNATYWTPVYIGGDTTYTPGYTYDLGDLVVYPDIDNAANPGLPTVWESLSAGNADNTPYSSPAKWLNSGAVNACKMFSGIVGEQSGAGYGIEVGIVVPSSEPFDALALLNIAATSVRVQFYTIAYSGAYPLTLVYDQTRSSLAGKTDITFMDIPAPGGGMLKVTLSDPSYVAIGELVKGVQTLLGTDADGAKISIIDYSSKTVDAFGNYTVVPRSYAKRLTTNLLLNTSDVDSVANILASIRATPTAWVGDGNFGSLIIYGFYKSFDLTLSSAAVSNCSLEIEGLI